jgi:hypothetical protein
MKLRTAALLIALLAPSLSLAQGQAPLNRISSLGTMLATTTLDNASESFTWDTELKLGAWGLLVVYAYLTDANDSVTALTMTCYARKGGNDYTLQSIAVAAGVGTSTDASWVKDASGSTAADTKLWVWRVDIEGYEDVKCTFTDTGGNSSDSISAIVDVATKGG